MSSNDLAYSLFGGPLILDVGPTVNGEIIRVRVQPINTISVTALVISLLLFIAFMCFYLYPIFRERQARQASKLESQNPDAEKLLPQPDEEDDKGNLLSWLHFRSRDRFSTHNASSTSLPRLGKQNSCVFSRGSLIPDLSASPVTPPPPIYTSRPNSPLAEYHFPASYIPALSTSQRSPSSLRFQIDAPESLSRIRAPPPILVRSRSDSLLPVLSTKVAARPFPGTRSVSANTLHPSAAQIHVPSRAYHFSATPVPAPVNTAESNVRHMARRKSGAGFAFEGGISLASRGRMLTCGPAANWKETAVP
ncbi:unnamed protein product [Mycena citricolor]|uniref:Uncharacterized protein n=1 Tax=Mycena citricolor TaxID=2018698 RepID=A0AAD2JYA3_9AGAR|nr:unnamed protein product [Mycena citricolor]